MSQFNRRVGCGLWMVWLLLAVFAGEWLLLWAVIRATPQAQLIPAVVVVIVLTILIGCGAVYLRIQRRMR